MKNYMFIAVVLTTTFLVSAITSCLVCSACYFWDSPIIVSIKGSNTIGAELMQLMVMKYAESKKATMVTRMPQYEEEPAIINAKFDRNKEMCDGMNSCTISFRIEAKGTTHGFEDLKDRLDNGYTTQHANMWMASSEVTTDGKECTTNGGKSCFFSVDVTQISVDGITVVVNGGSEIDQLSIQELRSIFSRNPTALPTRTLCIRRGSGTTAEFEGELQFLNGTIEGLLSPKPPGSGIRECSSNLEIASHVAGDINGIGYIPFSMADNNKLLKIVAIAFPNDYIQKPDYLSISRGEYKMVRHLRLYTIKHDNELATLVIEDRIARDLADFSTSGAGQVAVRNSGFLPLAPISWIVPKTSGIGPRDRPTHIFTFQKGVWTLEPEEQDRISNAVSDLCSGGPNVIYAAYGYSYDTKPLSTKQVGLNYLRSSLLVRELRLGIARYNNCTINRSNILSPMMYSDGNQCDDDGWCRGDKPVVHIRIMK